MLLSIASVALLLAHGLNVCAQGDSSLWPSWIPLAVRSPYFSTWMDTINVPFNASNVNGVVRAPMVWPQFLQGQINGWAGLIRIDNNQSFVWLGNAMPGTINVTNPTLMDIQITPTRTILTLATGPLDLVVTFLSPIELADPALQSLPFAYVSLEATSNDGQSHAIQVYSDVTGEWLSGDRTHNMNWVVQATNSTLYHQLQLQSPQSMVEINSQAEDGTMFYAMKTLSAQTYAALVSSSCRTQFAQNGTLSNEVDSGPVRISSPWPVFAISVDLGIISSTAEPVVWAVGLTRDPALQYFRANQTEERGAYWISRFGSAQAATEYFVADYPNAVSRAEALDQRVLADAANVSAHYADLVSLAARQAMGGTELTVGRSSTDSHQWNTSDVKMFLKDVGTTGRVSPVEGLYASFPFFLYLNATYAGWLLEPVLEYAGSDGWTWPYAPRDIGSHYPNATGNAAPHGQGVEQSGNMLIMTLAHARATGDGSLIGRYYESLKGWADYLGNNTFSPNVQISADSTDMKTNLTNLALKGILGIRAMAELSAAAGAPADAAHYVNISAVLAGQWQAQAVSSDGRHVLTSFGDADSSFALSYNLFADKLLKTNVIPPSLVQPQTAFLQSSMSTSSNGVQVDDGLVGQANTVWSLFAAAYSDDPVVQQNIVDQIWGRVSSNATDTGIFSTVYKLGGNGAPIGNMASPFIGGVFAPLSLNVPNVTINVPASNVQSSAPSRTPSTTPGAMASSKKSHNVGAIVGGVVGGLAATVALGFCGLVLRRKRPHRRITSAEIDEFTADPFPASGPSLDGSAAGQHGYRPSAKTREAALASQPSSSASGARVVDTAASGPSNGAAAPSAGAAVSPTAVHGLRAEVENLRRVMQTLQEVRYEPPPGYEPGTRP